MGVPLTGWVAAVTGAASGIGAAVAALLHERGATVVGLDLAVADEQPWEQQAVDVRDAAAVTAAIDGIAARHGRLDVLVTSAGVGAAGSITEATDDDWLRVLDINVVGTARAMRAAAPHLAASGRGSIVMLGSVVAHVGFPGRVVYSASKGAVDALMRAAAKDLVGEGVRVNSVAPGHVDTDWMARTLAGQADPAAARARLEARHPIARFATAREVAEAVVFLAGPASGFTTGTELRIDGGLIGLTGFGS